MYPTKEEFEEILGKQSLDSILDKYLFSGLPFSFRLAPTGHDQMLERISKGLGIRREDICIVGSARIGFSLSPLKFGKAFNSHSDIDVVVVSPKLFDPSWINVLANRRMPWALLDQATRDSLDDHRCQHYIHRGWIYPDKILNALDIGYKWLATFSGLSLIPELSSRNVRGRLYRTWDHARVYHKWSLRKVQEGFVSKGSGGPR